MSQNASPINSYSEFESGKCNGLGTDLRYYTSVTVSSLTSSTTSDMYVFTPASQAVPYVICPPGGPPGQYITINICTVLVTSKAYYSKCPNILVFGPGCSVLKYCTSE